MSEAPLTVSPLVHGFKGAPRWRDPYHCEWSIVVGDRVRRLRRERDLTLAALATRVPKPEGGRYSGISLSRLERGWASAPLYVYLAVARALDVEPGRLLGPDDAQRPVTEAEATLLEALRRIGLDPADAIALLVEAGAARAGAGARPGDVSPGARTPAA